MPITSILIAAVQLATFAIVVSISATLINRLTTLVEVRRRLGAQVGASTNRATTSTATLVRQAQITNPFLLWVQRSTSLSDPKDQAKLSRDLAMAGIEHPAAPALYVVLRFGAAIGLPLCFLISQQFEPKPLIGLPLIGCALGLCAVGLVAPRALLDNRIGARKTQLEQQFPDALDLMVVCVEAGLGLESALVRVGREVHESHPRVAEEFDRTSQELAAGRSRADALRGLADRAEVESVRSFAALLIQTDTLGTSIGQTLRTYSNEMRDHRMLAAEEKAMRIPVLLTVPLVACILPVIVTALMLPAIIDVVRNLLPALSGVGG
jgi:tight adherence protein C